MSAGTGRLAGRVAVITGAGSGIGRATALLFAREGARVVCADISGREEKTAAEIRAAADIHSPGETGAHGSAAAAPPGNSADAQGTATDPRSTTATATGTHGAIATSADGVTATEAHSIVGGHGVALPGPAAVAVRVDVANSAEVRAMIELAVNTYGRLDVLFNNAGMSGQRGPLAELDEDAFDTVVAVNLKGAFLGMKFGIPAMLASGGGSVINTASASALVGWKNLAHYAAAKGGVVQLTKSAALDYAKQGIRVNAICPGMTWTGLAGAGDDSVPPTDMVPPQPMNRWGLPGELASAALFLASDESSFVTGAAIPVDGGYVAR
ncbi:SDR family NAD(P)-dependent oxidoreductase [Nocardia aurantia]|uniref:3-phenylpropionate-dihydrodiol/cinnamic acid-dihydrodiol dehydrogenase n=1 Tax=Nocardia aurantia TaxID=2585199 RepID=A0A7K0DPJ9_9NOCA|nr:SDR family oxidoreductase [Nocardia aurantia]MQY27621.1 3-phenylpropionate-dihydrodiol/cinnamic acid-dihydrodiol dehydrogenase [Nocardia aurantia]